MFRVNTSNMSAKTGIGAREGTQDKLTIFLIIYRLFFYLLWYSLRVSGVSY